MKNAFSKLGQMALLVLFFINSVVPVDLARAQLAAPLFNLIAPLDEPYAPAIVRGLSIYPNDPFKFDFIIATGDDNLSKAEFKNESEKLIKYFLAALTVPEKELWVNLSPYEKNRVVPQGLGDTQMGIDMLSQDYLLKRLTASLTYPESNLGKEFWSRVYQKASQELGTTNIPVNTFNKVWIAPDQAVVYEKGNHVFIAQRHMKVMLEEDYLALSHQGSPSTSNNLSSQIVKQIVLPEIEKEVNSGKNFATLRQIYNSLILATWYKKKIKDSILSYAYANRNKVSGININDPQEKERIYQQYLKAFRKGIYNFVKEDADPSSGETIPRKYFSGGLTAGVANVKDLTILTDQAQLSSGMKDFILHPASSSGRDVKVTWQAVANKMGPDAAQATTILNPRELQPALPIDQVADFPAIQVPFIRPAERKPGQIPLFIDISDDLKTLTYYQVIDDSKVYTRDGSVHYEALSVANGSLKKIASFPSSNLVSPRKWMLEHFKNTPKGDLIDKLWIQGKRYTRFMGVTTSWDMRVDRDVWSTNIDTAFWHKRFVESILPALNLKNIKKVTEVGVGGGDISSLFAKIFPNATFSLTDISAYAISTTMLNMIANHPKGAAVLKQVKKFWGKGIQSLENDQDLIAVNPPYIPAAPFEKGKANDPYRGTGLIREIIKDGYKKLNPNNPQAAIYINISSLAEKDLQKYLAEFGGNIEFEKVGKPIRVPLKIKWISEKWKQWLLKNGGLEREINPASDQEEYWHALQMYRIRRKVETPRPKRVAIIGGTFDPLHLAHRKMIEDVRKELDVDEVIVVPNNISPHKLATPPIASGAMRYEMAKAAVAGLEGVKVSDFEINRAGASFSIDLVNHIEAQYPSGSKFYFVIGDDQVGSLDRWQKIDELIKKVDFVTYTRPGYHKSPPDGIRVQRIERPGIDISATLIRQRAALGFPIDDFVLPSVAEIIQKNDLYPLLEDIITPGNHEPIYALNGKPFREDKPYILVTDAHGVLLMSHWKKEYARVIQKLTGKSFAYGLQWVEDNIVRQMVKTTRDVPYDDIVNMIARELSLNSVQKTKEEIIAAIKKSREFYWSPNQAEAMPGAIEALRAMKKMGIPIKVVSGTKNSQLVYAQLQHAGFGDLIAREDVYAKDRQPASAPTDGTKYNSRELTIKNIMDGYTGHQLLLLDDWIQGANAAKNLNGTFIALPQGSGRERDRNSNSLRAEGAAMEITDARGYERLVSLLKVLNERRKERLRTMETKNVRVAMAQFNPTVGDLVGNTEKIAARMQEAKDKQTDIIVFPELAVTGYIPGDQLRDREFVDQNREMVRILAKKSKGITTVVGFVDINKYGQIYNAVAVLSDGEIKGVYRKRALPNYRTFNEKRWFIPGEQGLFDFQGNKLNKDIFNIDGLMFGVNDCEDIWVTKDGEKVIDATAVQEPVDHQVIAPYQEQAEKGARLIINVSASPFREGVLQVRDEMLIKRAREMGVTIVYLNTVGGQDEVVFDGNSLVVGPNGRIIARGKAFEEQLIIMDMPVRTEKRTEKELAATISLKKSIPDADKKKIPPVPQVKKSSPIELKFKALILGLQDYVRKNGFKKVIFGSSGGIDSILVAILSAVALGPENVYSVSLPTRFNSKKTKNYAKNLKDTLGIGFDEISIEPIFKAVLDVLLPNQTQPFTKEEQTAVENLQARIRMLVLMYYSNAKGYLLLSTSNKSESAVGYTTLYGDMSGGFALIKDLSKTDVFKMSYYANRYYQKIHGKKATPEGSIKQPPSAELRANQKDSDSLPDYQTQLDPLIAALVEDSLSIKRSMDKTKLPLDMVKRVGRLLNLAEYKRRQAPPGPKLTRFAFDQHERMMPITNRYVSEQVEAYIAAQKAQDHAMATDMIPIRRIFGENIVVEISSDKGPIDMKISEFNDGEIHTVLLNPQIVKGAHVTLAHAIDKADDVLQAILIMDHLRQYGVGKIDLLVKGQRFMGLEDGEDSADSYLITALSLFADKISYIDQKNFVHDIKNIQPFPPMSPQQLPLQVDRVLYLNNQFQHSAEDAVKILSNNAKADHIAVQNRAGLRFVQLPPDLQGQNVVVYHSTDSSDAIIDLVLTLIALRQQGVKSISLINSYLGYARQDKISVKGEALGAATVLQMINRLVDHHYVINAHYGKATGPVELKEMKGTEIYNLNGFVPTAEFMLNTIVAKITGIEKPQELSWDEAKKLGPKIKEEFTRHPVLIVGPDKGSKIYSQEAAAELRRLVKEAYGVDILVYVGYLPKERNTTTGEISRNEKPSLLDIDTNQPLTQLGESQLKDAWAFVMDDMTDTGGTLLSATYILVKKLGLQWRRVLTGVVHGVLSQKLAPFKTGLTAEEVNNATDKTLPKQGFIDDAKGRMPPVLLTAMETLLLPNETAAFKKVPMSDLVGYVIRRIIGKGLKDTSRKTPSEYLQEVLADNTVHFWELPPQEYVDYLNRFAVNHGYPKRNLKYPPVYTDPEVREFSLGPHNPKGIAQPDLDEPGISPEELERRRQLVRADIMRFAPDTPFVDGRPRNDLQTGLKGRAKMFNNGINRAEDPVPFRFNENGELETLVIDRGDGTGPGYAGGFAFRGQENMQGNTATRESIEEVLSTSKYAIDFREGTKIYDGRAYSSRDSDDAWVTTRAYVVLLSYKKSLLLTVRAADDAKPDSARWQRVDLDLLSKMVDAHPLILKRAVKAILAGDIQERDDLVKPMEALRADVSPKDQAMTSLVTAPNTLSDSFKIGIDTGFLNKPFSEQRRQELMAELRRSNPSYADQFKLFHMMPWDISGFEQEHMPSIVGVIKDKKLFSQQHGLRILDMAIRIPGQGWAIPKALEQFKEVILMALEHERLINPDFDKLYYVYITVDQKIVPPHTSQRRPGWHGDAFVSSETSGLLDADGMSQEVVTDNTYVISDALPTLFYPGPFPLQGVNADDIRAVLKRFEETARGKMTFHFPSYVLLRMTPYDLHTPDFNNTDQSITRTFIKIQFSRDRLNRVGNAINPLLNYENWYWVPRGEERNNRNSLAGWNRPDRDKFLWVNPNNIDFGNDNVNVSWLQKEFFWGIRVKGVRAEPAKTGEELITKNDGFDITKNFAKEGDWKVTTVLGGQYFLSDKDFRDLYRAQADPDGWHPPVNRLPLKMVEITKPIRFKARWGAVQYAPAGSILVKRDSGDIYAIHREDFNATYMRTDPQNSLHFSSTVTTKQQFDHVVSSQGRSSRYDLEFNKEGKDWKLKFQLPPELNLNEQVKQATFVLDVDETLAGKGLQEGITPENEEQIVRGFRLMKEHPDLKVKFIINSANTFLQYTPSRFGKTLPQLANDSFVQQNIPGYHHLLADIYDDLKAKGIEDPNKITLLVSRRMSIKKRILDPLVRRLKQEGLQDYLPFIELRTATGQETIEYDPAKGDFVYDQNPKLMFAEAEQLAAAKILLTGYLDKLGKKLSMDFSSEIRNINEAHKYLDTTTSIGVQHIFEKAIAKADVPVRTSAFNGEIGILFYESKVEGKADGKIDGKALSLEVLGQLEQQKLIKPHRPYYVEGDARKGIRISLFAKSEEIKRMVSPEENTIALGDAVVDTFLTDPPNKRTIGMYLGDEADMYDHPSVIVAMGRDGKSGLRERGTSVLMRSVFDVMEQGKTWGDVKFVNNLFSPNEVRDALKDAAQKAQDVGGINFDPAMMNLQIKKDDRGIPLPFDKQPAAIINISGFTPVIINIQPMTDLKVLLGIKE